MNTPSTLILIPEPVPFGISVIQPMSNKTLLPLSEKPVHDVWIIDDDDDDDDNSNNSYN